MRVYIAAPFFNEHQLNEVKAIEEHLTKHGISFFSPRSEGVLGEMPKDKRVSHRTRIFHGNIDSIEYCSHMIGCIEGRDTGTIFEIGVAYEQEMNIVLYAPDISMISVMLSEAADTVCTDIEKLKDSLFGNHNEYSRIGDTQ